MKYWLARKQFPSLSILLSLPLASSSPSSHTCSSFTIMLMWNGETSFLCPKLWKSFGSSSYLCLPVWCMPFTTRSRRHFFQISMRSWVVWCTQTIHFITYDVTLDNFVVALRGMHTKYAIVLPGNCSEGSFVLGLWVFNILVWPVGTWFPNL